MKIGVARVSTRDGKPFGFTWPHPIPTRHELTCPRAVKRAQHNNYRVKKPCEPATTAHPPSDSTRSTPAQRDQLKLRGIAPWTSLAGCDHSATPMLATGSLK